MDSLGPHNPYIGRLHREHRHINDRVNRIHSFLEQLTARLPTAAEIHQLTLELKGLYAELERHFDEEEQGGCIEDAVSRNPKLADEANRLFAEHAALLAQLSNLCRQLDENVEVVQSVSKVAGDFRVFADALQTHEAFENSILHQGHNVAAP